MGHLISIPLLEYIKMKLQILFLTLLMFVVKIKTQDVEVINAKDVESCEASTGQTCEDALYIGQNCLACSLWCKQINELWGPCCEDLHDIPATKCYCCYD